MKINQVLVESTQSAVAFAFGRFNPAHQGHIEVWQAVEDAGANWFIGTNATTIGPNDPLTFQQKSAWMEEIYPPIAGHIVAEQSVLTLAAYIFKKVRKNERATVAYITDATDWAWSGKLLNQYNGVEGAHGYYKFAEIIHEPSPRVSSATALRDAARADDKVAFYHASGTDPKLKVAGLSYFDTVKQACEKYPLPVKRGQKVKEQSVVEGEYDGEEQGYTLGKVLSFPEFVQQVSATLKKSNLNWKMTKRDDGVFLFSAPNDYNIHNMLVIAVVHNGWVSATNGVVYPGGEVSMGDKQELPMTVASVSEIAQEAIQSYHSLDLSDYADDLDEKGMAEHIVKVKGGWELKSKHGNKNLGKYPTKAGAEKRERQVQYFKHANEDVTESYYDQGDYYDAHKGGDYGRGLKDTHSIGSSGGTKRDDVLKGQSDNLPADPFKRTTGQVPKSKQGKIHHIARPEEMDETEQKTVAKTWDQMTAQEKSSGVKGRTVWNEKTQRYYTVFDVPAKQETEEGWVKNTAAGLALGAAAMGGAQANATIDDPSWHSGQYASHVKSDQTIQKQTGSPSVNQKRISDITGPNAAGEYRVTVTQNGKIASQFVTKTPPPDWMMKEQDLDEASLATMRDFFAGDAKAQDPLEITKQRLYFDPKAVANKRKEFRSQYEYEQWLKKHNLTAMNKGNK